MKLKRMESKEVSIGDSVFHIRPLGAMNAAYVFGDVTSIVLPILGTVAVAKGDKEKEKAMSLDMFKDMKLDTESLANALGKVNGDKLTTLIDELVLRFRNVSFQTENGDWNALTRDDFDEIFCADISGMVKLCVAVIQQNYSNFFDGLSGLFGSPEKATQEETLPKNTATLTPNA